MSGIIGRKKEIEELLELFRSDRAEFVAVYGRRRVGKTYLMDETLGRHLTFRHAGLSPIDDNGKQNMLKDQLQHFYHSLAEYEIEGKVIHVILRYSFTYMNGVI